MPKTREDAQKALRAFVNEEITEEDQRNGQSLLWKAAESTHGAAGNNDSRTQEFLKILSDYQDVLTPAEFRVPSQTGDDYTPLDFMIGINTTEPGFTLAFLQLYAKKFLVQDFLRSRNTMLPSETSLLYIFFITSSVKNNQKKKIQFVDVLNEFLDHYLEYLSFEDLNKPTLNCIYALGELAVEGYPRPFERVLEKFIKNLNAADLMHPNGSIDRLLLWPLIDLAKKNKPELLMKVFRHVVGLTPQPFQHLLNIKEVTELKYVFKEAHLKLLQARENFAQSLKTETDFETQKAKAKLAENAGYVEAFYELGQHYEQQNDDDRAMDAYLQMSSDSLHYDDIMGRFSSECLGEALQKNLEKSVRLSCFQKALSFALKLRDQYRASSVQRIAIAYLNLQYALDLPLDQGFAIPACLYQAMHAETPVGWCFEFFDTLAKPLIREKEDKTRIKKLEEEKKSLEEEVKRLRGRKKHYKSEADKANIASQLLTQFKNWGISVASMDTSNKAQTPSKSSKFEPS